MKTNNVLDNKRSKKEKAQGLCEIFKQLHHLKLNNDPFPITGRKNRPNPFPA